MKAFFYIWLSLIILLNSLIFSIIQMDYTINRAYIIDNFCVNKDKPLLECDGKCFLSEQLRKAQDQKENQNGGIEFTRDFGIFILDETLISLEPISPSGQNHEIIHQEGSLISRLVDIFHPPQAFA
jgi:hypothetical protein